MTDSETKSSPEAELSLTNTVFDPDTPIDCVEKDNLEFSDTADRITKVITTCTPDTGFVIGIEGEWGTGKTSLVNLIHSKAKKIDSGPLFALFQPWVINSRDGLLSELFSVISETACKVPLKPFYSEQRTGWLRSLPVLCKRPRIGNFHGRKLKELFSGFVFSATVLRSLKNALPAPVEPITGVTYATIDAVASISERMFSEKPLASQKQKIVNELKWLSKKIVVVIDDLDRLPPREAAEILRLIRAVADFPNVIYLLCYSRGYLTKCIDKEFGTGPESDHYLQKFIQASFSIPEPQPSELRKIFRRKIMDTLGKKVFTDDSRELEDTKRRLINVIQVEGSQTLKSPRCVAKVFNCVLLYSNQLLNELDLADLVKLQLIRHRDFILYTWIVEYMNKWSAIRQGDTLSPTSRASTIEKLKTIFCFRNRDRLSFDEDVRQLLDLVPGIQVKAEADENKLHWEFFVDDVRNEAPRNRQSKRFKDSNNFRTYVALTPMQPEDFAMLEVAETSELNPAFDTLLARIADPVVDQANVIDKFFDKLDLRSARKSDPAFHVDILRQLADSMDEIAKIERTGNFNMRDSWIRAAQLFEHLVRKLPDSKKDEVIKFVFRSGEAIGWITRIVYDEIFSHGWTGDHPEPESNWVFTEEQLENIVNTMINRYRSMSINEILIVPEYKYIFITWELCGKVDLDEIKKWISNHTVDDLMFLKWLYGLRGWRSVNGIESEPIKLGDYRNILDLELTRVRLNKLRNSEDENVRKLFYKVEQLINEWNSDFFGE